MGSSTKMPDKVHMVVERHGACRRCRPCSSCKDFDSKCGYDPTKVSYVSEAYVDWEAAYKDAFGKQVSWIDRTVRKGKDIHFLKETKTSILGMDLDVIQKLELLHDEIEEMEEVIPVIYNVLDLPLIEPKVRKGGHAHSDEDEEDDFDEDDIEDDDLLSSEDDDGSAEEEENNKNLKRRKN